MGLVKAFIHGGAVAGILWIVAGDGGVGIQDAPC